MSIILLLIVVLLLLYSVYKQDVGVFACFSILFFSIAVTLFHAISPALFSLNAVFHVGAFLVLLVWQFNYYSWKTVLRFITNPVILSILSISVIIYLYNGYSPYYYTYKTIIDTNQLNFYTKVLFPLLILPMMVPDSFSRRNLMAYVPLWGVIYLGTFLTSFTVSSNVLSDRMMLSEASEGITSSITLSRIFAVTVIASFITLISKKNSGFDKILYSGLTLLFLAILLIAGQRGTFIGLAIALMLLMIREEWRHHSFTILFLVVIGILFAVTFIDFGKLEMFQRFAQFQNIESFERYHDFFKTWNIFKDNNYFWGLGTLGYHFKTGRPYPHNIVLEHISDYGMAGLVCISVLLFFCIKYVVKIIKYSNDGANLAIACSWVVLCFSAMVSSSLLNHQLFYTFSGLLVLTYQDFKSSLEEQEYKEALFESQQNN